MVLAHSAILADGARLKSFRPKDEEKKDKPPPDDPGNPTVRAPNKSQV